MGVWTLKLEKDLFFKKFPCTFLGHSCDAMCQILNGPTVSGESHNLSPDFYGFSGGHHVACRWKLLFFGGDMATTGIQRPFPVAPPLSIYTMPLVIFLVAPTTPHHCYIMPNHPDGTHISANFLHFLGGCHVVTDEILPFSGGDMATTGIRWLSGEFSPSAHLVKIVLFPMPGVIHDNPSKKLCLQKVMSFRHQAYCVFWHLNSWNNFPTRHVGLKSFFVMAWTWALMAVKHFPSLKK